MRIRGAKLGLALGLVATVFGVGCDDDEPPPLPIDTSAGGGGSGGSGGAGGSSPGLSCDPAWPLEGTVARGQAPAAITWLTTCEGLAEADVERLSVGGEGTFAVTPRVVADQVYVSIRGEGVFAADAATGPALPDVDLTLSLDGSETTISAEGPRTHLAGAELSERYAAKAAASTSQVPPHTSLAVSLPVTNGVLMGSFFGLAPELLSTSWDDQTSELVLHATPLGGDPAAELGRVGATRSEGALLTGASTADGGARIFATTLCTDDPGQTCPAGVAFHQAIFNEGGQLVQLAGSGNAAVFAERPLDFGVPLARGFHQSPVEGPADLELRTLYPGLNGATAQWTVVDAFAVDFDGLPVVEAVSNLDAIAGVTPAMVANGDARIGLLRGFKADLDPTTAPLESDVLAWTARANPNGPGTTFALAALEGSEAGLALQEKTFETLQPGTASLHVVRWGTGQARVYAGVDTSGDLVAFVGAVDATTGVVGPTRPVDVPGTYRLSDAQSGRLAIDAWDRDDGGLFAMHVGFNTSEEDEAEPLDALLEGVDVQTMVFDAGGSTATTEPLRGFTAPRLLAEGTGSDVAVPTAGGHATMAPIDPALGALEPTACDPGQPCAIHLAESQNGIGARYKWPKETFQDRSYVFRLAPGGTDRYLFDAAPALPILQNGPPSIIDLGPAGSGDAEVIFSYLQNPGGDEGIGLLRVAIEGGEPQAEAPILVDGGGPILRLIGGNAGGYAIQSVGAQTQLLALPRDGSSTPTQTIATGLTDANGMFSDRPCPMADPSCAVTANPAADDTWSERLALAGKTVTREPAEGLDGTEPFPALLRVAELGGGACPLQTLLHPSFGRESAPVVLSTSTREDCADLAVPVAAGDFLGSGSEQFLLMAADEGGAQSTLALVWVEQGASPQVVHVDFGSVAAVLDPSVGGAARAIVAADVNEDGYPDLTDLTDSFEDVAGGPCCWLNDGRGGILEEVTSIPGLDAMGPRGPSGRPGGIQAATSAFGFGTRNTATETQSRTPLL